MSAKITDNKAMLLQNPGYIGMLKAMSEFDQEQLLNGNWKIRRAAGHYFKRSRASILKTTPTDIARWVRAWDLAATPLSENGADVRQLILNTARSDTALYVRVTIRLSQDPGQAGKDQA